MSLNNIVLMWLMLEFDSPGYLAMDFDYINVNGAML